MNEVSLARLYALRVMYGLIAFVMGSEQWRILLENGPQMKLMQGVGHTMLAALALVCLLGLWRPVQMLPLLLFEFAWKAVWLLAIALRLYQGGGVPDNFAETVGACLFGVVLIPIIIPWRHVIETYVKSPGDRWR